MEIKTNSPDIRGTNITLDPSEIDYDKGKGLYIGVPGFKGNPASEDNEAEIFIEVYEGKLRVHVWNGDQDPVTVECEKEKA